MTIQGSSLQPLWKDQSIRPYLGEIARRHGVVEILALDNMRDLPRIRIETLYVPPLLAAHGVDPDSDPRKWPEGMSLFAALEKHRRVVVLGDPGGGKTTLANWLAWRLAAGLAEPLPEFLEDMLPLPCVLRELPPELLARRTTPYELVTAVAKRLLGQRASNDMLRKLGARIEAGRYVLILDGVDEIPVAARPAVRDWVKTASVQGAIVLATSRTVGYDDLPVDKANIGADENFRSTLKEHLTKERLAIADELARKLVQSRYRRTVRSPQLELDGLDLTLSAFEMEAHGLSDVKGIKFLIDKQPSWAERYYLMPFDNSRIAAFAGNWYRQRCASEVEAQEKAGDLVTAVSRNTTTLRLARTPNLLTLMAVVHRERANLPDGKALLYDEIANAYINTIDTGRRLAPGPDRLVNHDWKERKAWLAYVAFMMQKQRNTEDKEAGVLVGGSDVRGWLAEAMDRAGVAEPQAAAEAYLGWVARRSGLLLPRGEERYAFVHLSFQEYFCACFLVDRVVSRKSALDSVSGDGTVGPKLLAKWAEESAWGEVFVFLFEKLSAERDANWVNGLAETIFKNEEGRWLRKMDDEDAGTKLAARVAVDRHVRLDAEIKESLIAPCIRRAVYEWQSEWYEPDLLPLLIDAGYACIAAFDGDSSIAPARQELPSVTVDTFDGLNTLPNLRLLIVSGKQADNIAPLSGLTGLQLLVIQDTQVSDLSPLSKLTGLTLLDLRGTQVADVTPLSGLTGLTWLGLRGTQVANLTPLSGLTSLQSLLVGGTQVSNLSPLSGLTSLQSLDLQNTQVSDLSALSGLTSLQSLELKGTQVSDLAPLSRLTALTWLNLQGTQVADLTPLSGLTSLQSLALHSEQISDISPLSGLTGLTWLDVQGTQAADLTALSGLTNLRSLVLQSEQISDLSPLSGLTGLEWLHLRGKQIGDLSPLSGLTDLHSLDLQGTQVSDLAPLSRLTGLGQLDLQGDQFSDLTPLATLKGLTWLHLQGDQISDLSPLAKLTGLDWLHLRGKQIKDLSPLSVLTGLHGLSLRDTQVEDLSPLSGLTGLQRLNLQGTQVSNLSPLSELTDLNSLDLKGTQISDLSPLSELTGLQELDLEGTQISDLSPLSGMTGLRSLNLKRTQVTNIAPLGGMTDLQLIDLTGTQVTDTSPLNHLKSIEVVGFGAAQE